MKLKNLIFRIAPPKKVKAKKEKEIIGRVIDKNGDYKCDVNGTIFSFTEDSFDLRGRTSIFTKSLINGRHVRIIRTKQYAIAFPGNKEQYIPFYEGLEIKGIKEKEKIKFMELNE